MMIGEPVKFRLIVINVDSKLDCEVIRIQLKRTMKIKASHL